MIGLIKKITGSAFEVALRCFRVAICFCVLAGTPLVTQCQLLQTLGTPKRLLPIRGEELLNQLKRPIPALKSLSISPDGSKILYLEVVALPGSTNESVSLYPDTWVSDKVSAKLWLLDVARGRRFVLPGYEKGLESIVRIDRLFKPGWSQDGRQIAFLEWRDNGLSLAVWSTDESGPPVRTRLSKLNSEMRQGDKVVNWVWLSEHNELILGLLPHASHSPSDDGPERVNEANKMTSFAWFLSRFDEEKEADLRRLVTYPSRGLRLCMVNLVTQSVMEVKNAVDISYASGNWTIARDSSGVFITVQDPRISTNSQVRQYQMMLITTGDPRSREFKEARSAIYFINALHGTAEKVYLGGPGYISSVSQLSGSRGLVIAENDPSLAVWPTAGVFGFIRWSQPNVNKTHIPTQPVVLPSVLHPGGRPDVVLQYEASYPEKRIYEVALENGQRRLITPKDFSATECDVSADGRTIAAVLENVNTPPEVFVWTTDTHKWRKLTDYAAVIGDSRLGSIEKITWRSKDDRFDIDGFLVKPRDFNPSKEYPLIVWVHGGPTGAYANEFNLILGEGGPPSHVLAAEGYLVLLPNYRGDRGYSIEYSRAILGHLDRTYDFDIDAGVDFLIAKGWADPKKLGIVGHSGGGMQLSYAISHTNRYKAAVNNDGPNALPEISLPEIATMTGIPQGAPNLPEGLRAFYGFDPVEKIWADPEKIRTPLLVRWSNMVAPLAGGEQELVYGLPFEYRFHALAQSKKLAYVLKRNNVPFEVIIDRDQHSVINYKYMLEYQSRLLQWFDYFILNKGENPIPAMKSPIDYSDEMKSAPK